MQYVTVDRSVIVTAQTFNLSNFKDNWFEKEGILKLENIDLNQSIFSGQLIQISSNDFILSITSTQVILSIRDAGNEQCVEIINKIINKLPNLAYSAIGVNYLYLMEDFDDKISSNYFFNNSIALFREFENKEEKPRFGTYLGKDFLSTRLQLSINPVKASHMQDALKDYMAFAFNFNRDLSETDNSYAAVKNVLDNWNRFKDYSVKLVNMVEMI